MDFKDSVKQISEKVEKIKENLQTEEATKTALVMPFLQALGYDVFNPLEIVPEYVCDIGTKKGEKIDYAIIKDGKPIILIECKHWQQDLVLHDNQLLRYFHVSNAKFGVLTNGIIYRFYTDLETPNKMDEKPFLEVDLTNIEGNQIEELKKFHKTYFDVDNILSSASELKYTRELKYVIQKEFASPSPELVRVITKQVYDGIITAKVLEQFTTLVRKALQGHMNETMTTALKSALSSETRDETPEQPEKDEQESIDKKTIITTTEELEGFMVIKSILRQKVNPERITSKDTEAYFRVLLDNQRKTICRLHFNNGKKKYLTILDEAGEKKFPIETIDDIYKYAAELEAVVDRFEKQ
ncbi:MAG: type I restriction enzyme HsdR N-terminal domain-containing protein [Prevotellaceae bacterium]|jgi:hypothetical protein|nr:type I restriction enzyme HsdR N-terminal domain-containing protein [Prevotellaceae bacterium]